MLKNPWEQISERYISYNLQPNGFKHLLTFLLHNRHKTYVWDFRILRIKILTIFSRFR